MSKKQIFVLDTNVLLTDPNSIFSFAANNVVIPLVVVQELDKHKSGFTETARNARQVSRELDKLRAVGKLHEGVKLGPKLGSLAISLEADLDLLPTEGPHSADMQIIATALTVKENHPKFKVILVSRDTNVRIIADSLGVEVEDYTTEKVDVTELYTGVREVNVTAKEFANILHKGTVTAELDLAPNEFVSLVSEDGLVANGRIDDVTSELEPLSNKAVWGLQPRNVEQAMALDLLLDDSIKLVTITGTAGCGKTLLALAAALHKVTQERKYDKVIVARPVQVMGKDVGYLPGLLSEKLAPLMAPIFDNLEVLLGNSKSQSQGSAALIEQGILEVEALTYIRGRSLPRVIFIIDEAQNLSTHEIKTIITRAGEGTKLIFTGDPEQIDRTDLDALSNGLTNVVEKFKGEKIAGHITLTKGERSELATLGSKLL